MFDKLHVDSILQSIVEYHEQANDVYEARYGKLLCEVLLLVAARPQVTFVQFGQLLGRLSV